MEIKYDWEFPPQHGAFSVEMVDFPASKIDKLGTVDANSGASGNELKGETCTTQNHDAISDGHVLLDYT